MKKSTRFSPEVRERAVRMVVEVTGQHDSQWAADRLDRSQDWLHGRDAAWVGSPA